MFRKSIHDLESRCEDVERPLNESRRRHQALQQDYDALSEAFSQIESEQIDRNLRLEALEAEKEQISKDLESSRSAASDLAYRLTDMEAKLRTTELDAEKALKKTMQERQAEEVAHRASLAVREEELEECRDHLRSLEQALDAKQKEAVAKQHDLDEALANVRQLEASIETLQSRNDDHSACIANLESKIGDLDRERTTLRDEGSKLKTGLDALRTSHSAEMAEASVKARAGVDTVMAEKSREIAELKQELVKCKESLSQSRAEVSQLHDTEKQQSARVDRRDRRIAELQKMVSHLLVNR